MKRKLQEGNSARKISIPLTPTGNYLTRSDAVVNNVQQNEDNQQLVTAFANILRGEDRDWELVSERAICKDNFLSQAIIAVCFTISKAPSVKDSFVGKQYAKLCVQELQESAPTSKWASLLLGEFYFNGLGGLDECKSQAVTHYRYAAHRGLAFAQFRFGYCLYHGLGIDDNVDEAQKYFAQAAHQGLIEGIGWQGVCLVKGHGVPKNVAEGFQLIQRAATKNVKSVYSVYGECFMDGVGVQANAVEAVRAYRRGCDNNDALCQFRLGKCFHRGTGVPQDVREAARCFRLAADQGHCEAQYTLGEWYVDGVGVAKDRVEGKRLLRLAVNQGYVTAMVYLGWLNLAGRDCDHIEAVELLQQASAKGCSHAKYLLGFCCREGRGLKKDPYEAIRFYCLAAAEGHVKANEILAKLESFNW